MSVNDEHHDFPSTMEDFLIWLSKQDIKGLVIGFSLETGTVGGLAIGDSMEDILMASKLANRYVEAEFDEFMGKGEPEEVISGPTEPERSGPVN